MRSKLVGLLVDQSQNTKSFTKHSPLSAGPYTGCGGVGFALLKAAQALPERLLSSVQTCNELLSAQLTFARAQNASKSRATRYLCGSIGLHVIQAICDHMSGRSVQQVQQLFARSVDLVCQKGYQRYGDDDLLNGRAGFLLAAQMVRNETGVPVLSDQDLRRVLGALLESGRQYAREHSSPAPLFYEWHSKEYLGAAHGLSGILQALLT